MATAPPAGQNTAAVGGARGRGGGRGSAGGRGLWKPHPAGTSVLAVAPLAAGAQEWFPCTHSAGPGQGKLISAQLTHFPSAFIQLAFIERQLFVCAWRSNPAGGLTKHIQIPIPRFLQTYKPGFKSKALAAHCNVVTLGKSLL